MKQCECVELIHHNKETGAEEHHGVMCDYCAKKKRNTEYYKFFKKIDHIIRTSYSPTLKLREIYELMDKKRMFKYAHHAHSAHWAIKLIEQESYPRDTEYRECDVCTRRMKEGYCIGAGEEYYCSKKCLNIIYTDEEFNKMYDNGNGESYYTAWDSEKYEDC